jgi:tetratricopeptide (TPR) repeat protein
LNRADLPEAELQKWRTLYQQGVASEEKGELEVAAEFYQHAAEIDDDHADLCFRRARYALGQDELQLASGLYRRARDHDVLQFRTDSHLNERIREAAVARAGQRVTFLNCEEVFASRSPGGIPGGEFFLEHVHLNPEGNYLLARAIAEEVIEVLSLSRASDTTASSVKPGEDPGGDPHPWLPVSDCLDALGFTEWNRHEMLRQILGRMEQAPFTHQLDHSIRIQALRARIEGSKAATKPAQLQRAAQVVAKSVERRPEDADLRWNLAQLLDLAADAAGAEAQWRAVIALHPHAHLPFYNLANLLALQGRDAEARQLYQECLKRNPEFEEARRKLMKAR